MRTGLSGSCAVSCWGRWWRSRRRRRTTTLADLTLHGGSEIAIVLMQHKYYDKMSTATLTVRLRGIPKHDTSEGRILVSGCNSDASKLTGANIATAGSRRRGGRTDVDFDVLVRRLSLSPVIPRVQSVARLLTDRDQYSPSAKVPVIGVAVLS